jgi:putative SOS response-associated peptidase YedK
MCGRFTLRRDLESVYRELCVEAGGSNVLWSPRYNIAPTDQVPILMRRETGMRDLTPMSWEIPRSRGGRVVPQINARAETIPPRPSAARSLRIDFTSGPASKVRRGSRTSFTARMTVSSSSPGSGSGIRISRATRGTFTIVTTAANALMAPIHERMPAILEGDSPGPWLNPQSRPPRDLPGLLAPARDELLEFPPVSSLVNSVKNEGSELRA